MLKLANVLDEETKVCAVASGDDIEFYRSISMTEMEVELGYDGSWYVAGYAPVKPAPTREEQQKARENAYKAKVDPITCHINRLKDEEQTPEVIAEIASLVEERKAKVDEIKAHFPYPVEPIEEINELPAVEEVVVSKMENVEESEEVIEDGLQREEKEIVYEKLYYGVRKNKD